MEHPLPQDRIWISPAMLRRPSSEDSKATRSLATGRAGRHKHTRLSAEAPEFYPVIDASQATDPKLGSTGYTSQHTSPLGTRITLTPDMKDHSLYDNGKEMTTSDTTIGCTDTQMVPFDQLSFDSEEAYTTNSRVWVAPKTAEVEKWQKTKGNLQRMSLIPKSPNLPKTFSEWLQHRTDFLDLQAKELREILRRKEKIKREQVRQDSKPVRANQPFQEEGFQDGRSPVLARRSIWSPWPDIVSGYEPAPWPSIQEMKEEGDERHTSGYGRFLALPRVPGNPTVNHKQRNRVEANELDKVWVEPIGGRYNNVEKKDYDYEHMRLLLGKDMLDALKD